MFVFPPWNRIYILIPLALNLWIVLLPRLVASVFLLLGLLFRCGSVDLVIVWSTEPQ